ncbi:DNA ligase D, 3'-phosphoesterase domain protein [Methanosalsum zhilinae DSM 4017]|uniref:DNA ligase D, 3'-phosphoesterase domain protein n=1 Tax=Methanosalsum zhilinae (strain DSM 4017 / NBRC 107636 / OCM 62 / WeN5) TaxID=679901 RepID=F7XLS2_METZD|nr:DNA polymerase ligase N-terminal domain-containing protein [Methanosalsum zhilinae]AEH60948.1 DNA ligase D, 3'-phosphoesterase domain protein [Methanosalsum zhilinae DSM 4017]
MSENLAEYKKKRDFNKTSEPSGNRTEEHKYPVFVIQKHNARNLHYDLRLEVDGVLKSWAVPKGPSMDPSKKRLAIETEDHPIEYANFEGVIPEDEYGGGTVIVWDKGTYENINEKDDKLISMKDSIKKGHVKVILSGEKVQGKFALIKSSGRNKGQWLLLKMKGEDISTDHNGDILDIRPESVLSGKTIEDIEKI